MESSPRIEGSVYGDDQLSSGSPSARTPVVQVVMPGPRASPATSKRRRDSNLARIERAKLARTAVGSPSIRMINRMVISPPTRMRSPIVPRGVVARNSSSARHNSRKLKSVYWKEFEPIMENGEILHAKCIHCHDYLSGKQSIGTSHLKKHLERCREKSKVTQLLAKLRAGATPSDIDPLENWVYDYDLSRKALVRLIVLHELLFSLVDYDGFREFVASLNPLFKMVSRTTIALDCMAAYQQAKMELREVFKNSTSKVSLTADMWTSNQTLGYLCVTCHWISDEWKIHKRIIKFLMLESPHNAESMFNSILKGIQEWNVEDKLFSITLDNAKVNNSMMGLLRANLLLKRMLPCQGNLFHVRCGAHVINLVVQDGLKQIGAIVSNIRESVKYVQSSQARKEKFGEIVVQLGISVGSQPKLDICTRWNSTYLMLKHAFPLSAAFDELDKKDPNYHTAPSPEEWVRSNVVYKFLKVFYDATVELSGTSYPTAHRYFLQLWKIKLALDKESSNEDEVIVAMVNSMQQKFKHYWEISYLWFSIPVILDPRFKFSFVEFRLNKFFGNDSESKLDSVRSTLRGLFNEYSSQIHHSNTQTTSETSNTDVNTEEDDVFADWDEHRNAQLRTQSSSELDAYLLEPTIPRTSDLDILNWWMASSSKYPILARMARDVLSTPASTVASESAFSTGERVVSDFRSRLNTDTVEALICLQDWLRAAAPSPEQVTVQVVV